MVNIIEFGLFLYSLGGSASIGYWALISFIPDFYSREKNYKLGYSFVVGAAYTLIVFLISFFLSEAHFNNMAFLEIFFWLIPVSFIVLASVVLGRKAIEMAQQRVENLDIAPEEMRKESMEIGEPMQPIHTISIEKKYMDSDKNNDILFNQSGKEKELEEAFNEINENAEEEITKETPLAPMISDEEPAPQKKIKEKEISEIKEEPSKTERTEQGKQEQDVEEEIKRIMMGEPVKIKEAIKAEIKKKPGSLSEEEIEKIKKELKRRMDEEKK